MRNCNVLRAGSLSFWRISVISPVFRHPPIVLSDLRFPHLPARRHPANSTPKSNPLWPVRCFPSFMISPRSAVCSLFVWTFSFVAQSRLLVNVLVLGFSCTGSLLLARSFHLLPSNLRKGARPTTPSIQLAKGLNNRAWTWAWAKMATGNIKHYWEMRKYRSSQKGFLYIYIYIYILNRY